MGTWKDAAKGNRPQLPFGYSFVTAVDFKRERRGGSELRSNAGPFLLVVYEDEHGAQGTVNYFLTDKAQWKLARDLSRLGVGMDELDERGIGIQHFLEADNAREEMEGRQSWARINPSDSKYVDVELVTPEEVPPELRGDTGPNEPEQGDAVEPPSFDPNTEPSDEEHDDDNLPF